MLQKHIEAREREYSVTKTHRGKGARGAPGLPLPHTMNGLLVVEERYAL